MVLKVQFKPEKNIPYYYACYFPALQAKLHSMGVPIPLGLLACDDMYCVPSYSLEYRENGTNSTETKKLLNQVSRIFGRVYTRPSNSFQEGLQVVRDCLRKGEISILRGTSFHLPYSTDYQSEAFIKKHTGPNIHRTIRDHYLCIYGLDGVSGALVYDPVPHKYVGAISLEDLNGFWKGNRSIREFEQTNGFQRLSMYGISTLDLRISPDLPRILSVARALLQYVVDIYLSGETVRRNGTDYHFGRRSLTALVNDFKNSPHLDFSRPIFDLRFSRYYLRDFLYDVFQLGLIENNVWTEISSEIQEVVVQTEEVHKKMVLFKTKTSDNAWHELQNDLNILLATEDELYTRMKTELL